MILKISNPKRKRIHPKRVNDAKEKQMVVHVIPNNGESLNWLSLEKNWPVINTKRVP